MSSFLMVPKVLSVWMFLAGLKVHDLNGSVPQPPSLRLLCMMGWNRAVPISLSEKTKVFSGILL